MSETVDRPMPTALSISYAEIIPKHRNSCRQALYYCGSPQVISTGSGILGDP